jgi:hypothetical protein
VSASDPDYTTAWKHYRRLRLHYRVAFAGFGLSGFAIVLFKLPSQFGTASLIPVVAFWLYVALAGSRLRQFPCPRCDKYFEKRWPTEKRFAPGSCPHCGLAKFSAGE